MCTTSLRFLLPQISARHRSRALFREPNKTPFRLPVPRARRLCRWAPPICLQRPSVRLWLQRTKLFSFLGIVHNGYRTGSVFQSIHANGPGGIPDPTNFEVHEDLLNPASGLFGALGHGLVDYGLGKLNRLGIHINLDGKC